MARYPEPSVENGWSCSRKCRRRCCAQGTARPDIDVSIAQFAAIQAVASSLDVELVPLNVRDAAGIDRTIATFAARPNGGLIVSSNPFPGEGGPLSTSIAFSRAKSRLTCRYKRGPSINSLSTSRLQKLLAL